MELAVRAKARMFGNSGDSRTPAFVLENVEKAVPHSPFEDVEDLNALKRFVRPAGHRIASFWL
jgi:hypothetical protein